MKEPKNARGYAYTALAATWQRQLSWSAFAAANKHGYYPTLSDYTSVGLATFDRMYATATHDDDTLRGIMQTIIADMANSMAAEWKGHFGYPLNDEGVQIVTTKHDVVLDAPSPTFNDVYGASIADLLPDEEEGYAKADDDDLMAQRLSALRDRLSDEDMTVLIAYIEGATMVEAAGGAYAAQKLTKRVRYACRGLQGMEMFA